MYKIVLLRHGESTWNKENLFTGWTDVDLSEKGIEEAHNAGKRLQEEGFVFDETWTSVLKRAIRTLWIVLDEMDASLHFEIVVSLIRIFNNKDINKNNAQLIFNTHNPIYLDGELLRHDQIVMVEKRRNDMLEPYAMTRTSR